MYDALHIADLNVSASFPPALFIMHVYLSNNDHNECSFSQPALFLKNLNIKRSPGNNRFITIIDSYMIVILLRFLQP